MDARWLALVVVAVAGIAVHRHVNRPVRYDPGIYAPFEPVQNAVTGKEIYCGNYTATPLATYEVVARLVKKRNYLPFENGVDLSPTDFGLAWGGASDQATIDQLDLSLSGRYLTWSAPASATVDIGTIPAQMANTHMIPATREIRKQMIEIREGEFVRLKGYLVQVTGQDGFVWSSSMSRNDTGGGACEVMYCEKIEVLDEAEMRRLMKRATSAPN